MVPSIQVLTLLDWVREQPTLHIEIILFVKRIPWLVLYIGFLFARLAVF